MIKKCFKYAIIVINHQQLGFDIATKNNIKRIKQSQDHKTVRSFPES